MSNLITASAKVDMGGLNRALSLVQDFTKRTPVEACNTAGFEIAISARQKMPAVSADTVNAQLAIQKLVIPRIGKSGKSLKPVTKYKGAAGTAKTSATVPLSWLIIFARANPGSNYNILTNSRYALSKNPFAGVTKESGAAAMAQLEHSMIASRRKSGGFYKLGWLDAIRILRPLSVNKWIRGGSASASGMAASSGHELGTAEPAVQGASAQTIIENDIGLEGQNRRSMNEGLIKYGLPALQSAVDNEGRKQMEYYLEHAGKDLERRFNATT